MSETAIVFDIQNNTMSETPIEFDIGIKIEIT